jgi:ribulose bisphosphate carboxylase small subunit
MASLKITLTDGETIEQKITPAIEFAFEQHHKIGFHKAFREREQQSDLYWLAWEALRRSGKVVKPFGVEFVSTLESVDVVEDSDPK